MNVENPTIFVYKLINLIKMFLLHIFAIPNKAVTV